jgi:hypothetical protein
MSWFSKEKFFLCGVFSKRCTWIRTPGVNWPSAITPRISWIPGSWITLASWRCHRWLRLRFAVIPACRNAGYGNLRKKLKPLKCALARHAKSDRLTRGLAGSFFDWCAAYGLELTAVRPFHVSAWIEDFPGSKPTVKQKLAAVRMLYDFLVVRQSHARTPHTPCAGQSMWSRKARRLSGSAKMPRRYWIQFQRIRCPAYGTGRSLPRCSTVSPV